MMKLNFIHHHLPKGFLSCFPLANRGPQVHVIKLHGPTGFLFS